jgi:hypothetical protein
MKQVETMGAFYEKQDLRNRLAKLEADAQPAKPVKPKSFYRTWLDAQEVCAGVSNAPRRAELDAIAGSAPRLTNADRRRQMDAIAGPARSSSRPSSTPAGGGWQRTTTKTGLPVEERIVNGRVQRRYSDGHIAERWLSSLVRDGGGDKVERR